MPGVKLSVRVRGSDQPADGTDREVTKTWTLPSWEAREGYGPSEERPDPS